MNVRRAGVSIPPGSPDPGLPLPEPLPAPERAPMPSPWQEPDIPGRKVNLPPELPHPGIPVEAPERVDSEG